MDPMNIDQHISQQFNADLEQLRSSLLEMGGLVEEQLSNAIEAIETANSELAEKVLEVEDEVDNREVEIDSECMSILARRQPAASDLRLVMMVSKAVGDLERMGDESRKIAKMALALNTEQGSPQRGFVELRHLATEVKKIVRVSLDAFARYDVNAAIKVVRDDKEIDIEYKTAVREMITYMMEDPRQITRVMNILWTLRALERIGDHAMNIAEQVIYLVRGKDVRHTPIVEIEKQLETKR